MDSTEPRPPRHTEEDLARGRANPLFTLGLDDPHDGMFRISFTNGDLLALHVRGDVAARAAAREVTRRCIYDWELERYSPDVGWVTVPPDEEPTTAG